MPLRVHVHAAIWVDGKLAVHRRRQHARDHLTLPGGRVKDRESVGDALRREVREEIGHEVDVEDLLLAGEVTATSRQDVVLVFKARLRTPDEIDGLALIDPRGPEANTVLPPVLDRLMGGDHSSGDVLWLGNLYDASLA